MVSLGSVGLRVEWTPDASVEMDIASSSRKATGRDSSNRARGMCFTDVLGVQDYQCASRDFLIKFGELREGLEEEDVV